MVVNVIMNKTIKKRFTIRWYVELLKKEQENLCSLLSLWQIYSFKEENGTFYIFFLNQNK